MTKDKEILQKLLASQLDLYKFYYDMSVKINIFFYGITGGILSYYLANYSVNPMIKNALLVPMAFSGFLAIIFFHGARTLAPMEAELGLIAKELEAHSAFSTDSLKLFLTASSLVFILVLAGMLFLYFK